MISIYLMNFQKTLFNAKIVNFSILKFYINGIIYFQSVFNEHKIKIDYYPSTGKKFNLIYGLRKLNKNLFNDIILKLRTNSLISIINDLKKIKKKNYK